jgi:acyl-CoA synthetase (AMP-forming)/AMP-acid ligase II
MTVTRLRLDEHSVVAPRVPAALQADYERCGYTSRQLVSTLAERAARQWPNKPALYVQDQYFTYQEMAQLVSRGAAWLAANGVGVGDVVLWQTPNCWEAHVLAVATWHLGAVSAPVVPFYREHELRQVIEQVRPSVVIAPTDYRGFPHAEMFDDLLASAGHEDALRVALRGERRGWVAANDVLSFDGRQSAAVTSADAPCLVLFTSGTTSAPKGAVHSSRTLLAETRQLVDAWGLSYEDRAYMAAPLQHITGLLNAITMPMLVGAAAVVAERWEPDRAVQDILRHSCTYSAGATVFLQELTEAAASARVQLPLRMFACGGASVPRAVMERSEAQGIPAARVYGMTELPTVTVMNASLPFAKRSETDGAIAPGVEVRVVDEGGRDTPTGSAGELLVRGPERMIGYLDSVSNDAALDADGWFRTGDVGLLRDGHITVTGRLKDIINRGGEKFSAREIEDLLASHPGVRAAAIVPSADARLGEVPVAFVVLESGASPSPDDLKAHILAEGLARQKSPVEWHFVATLPTTPSGKVKKFELTRMLSETP